MRDCRPPLAVASNERRFRWVRSGVLRVLQSGESERSHRLAANATEKPVTSANGFAGADGLGFLVSIASGIACSRGEMNREHLVTVPAPEEADIVHLHDAGDAQGAFTEGTRG